MRMQCVFLCLLVCLVSTGAVAQSSTQSGNTTDACKLVNEDSDTPGTVEEPVDRTRLELKSATPDSGATLDRSSTIVVDFDYALKDFVPGEFYLFANAESVTAQASIGIDSAFKALEHPAGHVRRCFSFYRIWDDERVKWPMTLRFVVVQTADFRSFKQGAAALQTLSYSADTISAELLAKQQALIEPDEFTDAMHAVTGFFDRVEMQRTLCAEKFPGLRSSIIAAYRRWVTRHAALRAEIGRLQFESMLRASRNELRGATSLYDSARSSRLQGEQQRSEDELRHICQSYVSYLASEEADPDRFYDQEIDAIRSFVRSRSVPQP